MVNEPLHLEGALQGGFNFGIQLLASLLGAAPSPQCPCPAPLCTTVKTPQLLVIESAVAVSKVIDGGQAHAVMGAALLRLY